MICCKENEEILELNLPVVERPMLEESGASSHVFFEEGNEKTICLTEDFSKSFTFNRSSESMQMAAVGNTATSAVFGQNYLNREQEIWLITAQKDKLHAENMSKLLDMLSKNELYCLSHPSVKYTFL